MPLELHSTVPNSVRSIILSTDSLNRLTAECREIGIRLVSTSYPDMRSVWESVRLHEDAEFPGFFFHCAVELPTRWQRMSKMPTKALQHAVSEIAAAAEALAHLLETHQDEITFHRGSPLTFHDAMLRARTIRAEVAGDAEPPRPGSYAGQEHYRLPPPTPADFVLALAAELRPSRTPPQAFIRPTKVGDKNAERTFMVRALWHFLNSAFGNPSVEVVAVTVNTILDASDDLLDADYVRKLVFNLQ